jgi:hypothetical protein
LAAGLLRDFMRAIKAQEKGRHDIQHASQALF